jgi:hypothetical protein
MLKTMHLLKVTRVIRNGLKWIKYDPTIRWHRDKMIYYHISILGVGCGYTETSIEAMIITIFLLVPILFFIFCLFVFLF